MKVSVIIPYNEDRGFLKDAVMSCKNQKGFTLGKDYEIILQRGDCYVGKNVNDAVAKAKGKYIKKCDEDDLLTPNCLKDLYEFAEDGYDFVCANAIAFEAGKPDKLTRSYIPDTISELAEERSIHISSGLYLKSAMLKVDESLPSCEDFDLILRMADLGRRFGYLNKCVYKYRIWHLNKSQNRNVFNGRFRLDYLIDVQEKFMFNHKEIRR